jgi:hypothetical protein
MLAAISMWRCSSSDSDCWRSTKEIVKTIIGHHQPLAVIEIIHVHPETAVILQIEEMLENLF